MSGCFTHEKYDLSFLKKEFLEVGFQLYKATVLDDDQEDAFFSAFVCLVKDENKLDKIWSGISNLIGVDYQSKLNNEFSRWNIYLFFLTEELIGNEVKYKIENDKFFVRKLVLDGMKNINENKDVSKYLNNHILDNDITIHERQKELSSDEYNYSDTGKRLLSENIPLSQSDDDKEVRTKWLENEMLRGAI